MNVFTGVAPSAHYDTIRDAVVQIVKRARSLSLTKGAWSLVELQLDQEDFNWLSEWARHLSPAVATRCLNGQWKRFQTEVGDFSYSTGIGILLLMFAVEVARRNASERSLWIVVSHSCFSTDTQRTLFVQNYPTRVYKDAIELAARWLNLRHVFGMANLQNWYDTIYLQLGFTRRGFVSRLPEWLVGQNSTFAIQQLVDGPMRSNTFSDLWTTLGAFRRKNISEEQLRRKLQNNPWILQEWIPELIQQAVAKLHLAYIASDKNASLLSTDESFTEAFLDSPILFWNPPLAPVFTCRIINLALFDLIEPVYSVMVADRICGQLRRCSDGSYKTNSSDKIILPATTSLVVASLVAPDGSIIQNQALQLWDEGEDISAYTSAGKAFDPWEQSLSTKQSYYLFLASDLDIQPRPDHWCSLNVHTKLYLLGKDWPAQTQVLLEESVLWVPDILLVRKPQKQLDEKAIEIYLYDTQELPSFGQPIRFQISHPRDYTIVFVRSEGQSINFAHHTPHLTVTDSITLQPYMLSTKEGTDIKLTLGIQLYGSSIVTRCRYSVRVPIIGAARLDKDGWTALDETQSLNIEQAKRQLMRFYLTDAENWPLLEGDTWIDNAWKTPKTLQKCAGFGASLKIQKSAYNASAFEQPQQIVREVVNTGCVQAVAIANEAVDAPSRKLHLWLSHFIEPDDFHRIVWWDQNGSYILLEPEHWEDRDGVMYWCSSLPFNCTQPLAIAVAYNRVWLGTWYSRYWNKILSASDSKVGMVSALLRWFHLPLLGLNVYDEVERFSYANAGEVLATWLDEQCPLPDLNFTSSDEGWLSVVRKVFFNWQPEGDVGILVQSLSSSSSSSDLLSVAEQVVWKLLRVSPILMAKVLLSWVEHVCILQWGILEAKVLIRHLLNEVAGGDGEISCAKLKDDLLREVATMVMKVDTNFIKKALLARAVCSVQGQPMKSVDRENIAVAMQIEPFRRLLSIHLLEYILGQLEANRGK